jgi:hypothetical protein
MPTRREFLTTAGAAAAGRLDRIGVGLFTLPDPPAQPGASIRYLRGLALST